MRKFKKPLIILATVILAIAVYAISINIYFLSSQKEKIVDAKSITGDYQCIFVLGCGVRSDGTPSHMLQDRLETAIELYNQGVAPIIVMSGDNSRKDYDEVGTMKKYAVNAGVPESAIVLDHAGFSTYDSMYRAKEIFSIESAVVVTQEYHLYRALYNAEEFGIKAVGVSANVRVYSGQLMRDIREIIARNKDFIFSIFKPKPKFLGEKIDIFQ